LHLVLGCGAVAPLLGCLFCVSVISWHCCCNIRHNGSQCCSLDSFWTKRWAPELAATALAGQQGCLGRCLVQILSACMFHRHGSMAWASLQKIRLSGAAELQHMICL
jgi:hypothetical protein